MRFPTHESILAGANPGFHFNEPWMNEIDLDGLESMERLEKRAEQSLVIIILSMATLIVCLVFLMFH